MTFHFLPFPFSLDFLLFFELFAGSFSATLTLLPIATYVSVKEHGAALVWICGGFLRCDAASFCSSTFSLPCRPPFLCFFVWVTPALDIWLPVSLPRLYLRAVTHGRVYDCPTTTFHVPLRIATQRPFSSPLSPTSVFELGARLHSCPSRVLRVTRIRTTTLFIPLLRFFSCR